jgi:hypothetical protein
MVEDQREKVSDIAMGLDRVAQIMVGLHTVVVAPAYLLTLNESFLFEVGKDLLDGALGNPHPHGNLTQDKVRFGIEQDQDVRVIREECPAVPSF